MKRKVLNKGFVELTGVLGDETSAVTTQHLILTFHVKCPVFVAHQWFRHHGSTFTEVNNIEQEEYYVPSYFQSYNYKNLSEVDSNILHKKMDNFNKWVVNFYNKMINDHSISREQARMILPHSLFTEFYWTVNAKSLMRFLKYKVTDTSKWEMQEYSKVILDMFREKLPSTVETFLIKEFGK